MIPDFDIHGVLPPIRPGAEGHSLDRAPYQVQMLEFCQRFGGTAERRIILGGLLELRRVLCGAGVDKGLQWLNGSFAEDVERLQGRSPADIDVVTFASVGDENEQRDLSSRVAGLFGSDGKARYHVDHYLVPTDQTSERLIGGTAYWYSMWSHHRDTARWKGFVAVPLQSDDEQARAWIERQAAGEGGAP